MLVKQEKVSLHKIHADSKSAECVFSFPSSPHPAEKVPIPLIFSSQVDKKQINKQEKKNKHRDIVLGVFFICHLDFHDFFFSFLK